MISVEKATVSRTGVYVYGDPRITKYNKYSPSGPNPVNISQECARRLRKSAALPPPALPDSVVGK